MPARKKIVSKTEMDDSSVDDGMPSSMMPKKSYSVVEEDDVLPVMAPKRRAVAAVKRTPVMASRPSAVTRASEPVRRSATHPKETHIDVHRGTRSVPVLHTMPMAIDREHFWHVALEEHHYDWLGRLLAVMVVASGALMFLVSPVLHQPVLTFLQPWVKPAPVVAPVPVATTVPVSTVLLVSIKPTAETAGVLFGRVVEAQAKASAQFATTGQVATADSHAGGTVKIVNTADRSFAFVAKTRVLSKDGVLFRLTAPASIPAKKSVVVEVVADEAGPAGDIEPTQFTLPGLPTSELREQVFAVSDAAMTGGSGVRSVVTEVDLAKAKTALQAQLVKSAQDDLQALVKPEEKLLPGLVNGVEGKFNAPAANTVSSSFEAVLEGNYQALLFPEQQAIDTLRAKVATQRGLAPTATIDLTNVKYIVQAYDTKNGVAELRVEADAPAK